MTLDLNAIKADLDQTQDPKDAAADWLRARGHLVAAVAEIERLTAERDEILTCACGERLAFGVCDKCDVPKAGEPRVKLSTLILTVQRVTRAETALARLTADHAALRTVVREVNVTGERWHDAWAKHERWQAWCQDQGALPIFHEEFGVEGPADEDAIHDELREAEGEHLSALSALRALAALGGGNG